METFKIFNALIVLLIVYTTFYTRKSLIVESLLDAIVIPPSKEKPVSFDGMADAVEKVQSEYPDATSLKTFLMRYLDAYCTFKVVILTAIISTVINSPYSDKTLNGELSLMAIVFIFLAIAPSVILVVITTTRFNIHLLHSVKVTIRNYANETFKVTIPLILVIALNILAV